MATEADDATLNTAEASVAAGEAEAEVEAQAEVAVLEGQVPTSAPNDDQGAAVLPHPVSMPAAPAAPETLLSLATSEDTALQQKRTRTRPRCPSCGSDEVKTLGGGTYGKYRYSCQSCGEGWQQIPPHKLTGDGALANAEIALRKRSPAEAPGELRQYKCGRCGQIKKGHVCTQQQSAKTTTAPVAPPPAAAVLSATAIPMGMQMSTMMPLAMSQSYMSASQTSSTRSGSDMQNAMYVLPYMPGQQTANFPTMACQYPVVSAAPAAAPGAAAAATPRVQGAEGAKTEGGASQTPTATVIPQQQLLQQQQLLLQQQLRHLQQQQQQLQQQQLLLQQQQQQQPAADAETQPSLPEGEAQSTSEAKTDGQAAV